MKFDTSPIPDYTIRFAILEGQTRGPALMGIEIQPPLDALAAEGLAKALAANSEAPGDAGNGPGQLVGEAHVTRQDEKGTVISAYRCNTNSRGVVGFVAALINPLESLNIKVDYDDHGRKKR